MTRDRRYDIIALAALAALPSFVFYDVLFGLKSFYVRDVLQYYFPVKKLLREIVLRGEFPFWNPWFSAGQPLAANPQHQVFYPLTWLVLLPDFVTGFQLLALVHVYIAAFGMYALLRSMGTSRTAACFGGLSFALSGLFASLLNLFPVLFSLTWLPLTCLFTRRYLLERRRRDFALAAFFFGLQLIVSEPVTILQSGIVLGMYALYRSWRDGGARAASRSVGVIALLSVTAMLVAAVQIVPAADLLGDSVRSRGIGFHAVAQWSMPPVRVAEMFFPHLEGRPLPRAIEEYWADLYGGVQGPLFYSVYAGLAVAVLAVAGFFARVRGTILTLAICVVSYVAALGEHTPILALLYDLGLMTSFRYPEKFAMMGVFAAVVFAACVLDAFLRGDSRVRKAVLVTSAVVLVVSAAIALFASTAAYEPLFRKIWAFRAGPDTVTWVAISRHDWIVAAVRALLLFLLFRTVMHRRFAGPALLCVFLFFDLAPLCREVAPTIDAQLYRSPPRVVSDFAPDRDDYRVFNYAHQSKRLDVYRRFGRHRYWVVRNALPMYLPAAYGLRTVLDVDYDMTDLLSTTDFEDATSDLAKKRARDWINFVAPMTNMWYVGVHRNYEKALASSADDIRRIEPIRFLEGKHWPRYYFAPQIVTIRDRRDFVEKLATGRFDRQAAYVAAPAFAPAPGLVRTVRETTTDAKIEVDAAGRAFLVMSVTPHKYWRVTLDGRRVSPIVTNLGFQGLIIPAGSHVVEMHYRNPLIVGGAIVSAVTLLLLAVVGWRRAAPVQCAPCD